MKRKGFTLIELLAVIVILAIIALIATPIVLNIIENTKEEANERSIDMYGDAVNNAIAKYYLNNTQALKAGNYTTTDGKTLTHETDPNVELTVDYDGNVVCESINITTVGEVTLSECKVNGSTTTYGYENGKVTDDEEVEPESICKLVDDVAPAGISEGDEYLCAVEEDMNLENDEGYTFFVLPGQNADGKTNLIMYANINEYGEPVDSYEVEDKGLVAWQADALQATSPGPVTAMNYLNTATSLWREELRLNETYDDEEENFTGFELSGKARLPKLSEVSDYKSDGTNAYLYDYMENGGYQTNVVSGVYGYWMLTAGTTLYTGAKSVYSYNNMDYYIAITTADLVGVRPVITVEL